MASSLYVDTSCLLKLLFLEAESRRVAEILGSEEHVVVSSLARLEAIVQVHSQGTLRAASDPSGDRRDRRASDHRSSEGRLLPDTRSSPSRRDAGVGLRATPHQRRRTGPSGARTRLLGHSSGVIAQPWPQRSRHPPRGHQAYGGARRRPRRWKFGSDDDGVGGRGHWFSGLPRTSSHLQCPQGDAADASGADVRARRRVSSDISAPPTVASTAAIHCASVSPRSQGLLTRTPSMAKRQALAVSR